MTLYVLGVLAVLYFFLDPAIDGRVLLDLPSKKMSDWRDRKHPNTSIPFITSTVNRTLPQLSQRHSNHTAKRRRVDSRWQVIKLNIEHDSKETRRENYMSFVKDESIKPAHRELEPPMSSNHYVIVKTDEAMYNLTVAFGILIISILVLIALVLGITLYYCYEGSHRNNAEHLFPKYNHNSGIIANNEIFRGAAVDDDRKTGSKNEAIYWWDKWDTRPKTYQYQKSVIPVRNCTSIQNASTQTFKEDEEPILDVLTPVHVDEMENKKQSPSEVRQKKLVQLFPGTSTDTVGSIETRKEHNPFKTKNLFDLSTESSGNTQNTIPKEAAETTKGDTWHDVPIEPFVNSNDSKSHPQNEDYFHSVPNNLESLVLGKTKNVDCSTKSSQIPVLRVSSHQSKLQNCIQTPKFPVSNQSPWFKSHITRESQANTQEQGLGRMKMRNLTNTTLDTLRKTTQH